MRSTQTPAIADVDRSDDSRLHLVLGVDRQSVALPIECVREILMAPRAVPVPGTECHVRGVIDVRGDVMPLVDLRLRLGRTSRAQATSALVQLLRDREADHLEWVRELEACVRENRTFHKARDPHACTFGRWYDTYRPENLALEFLWSGFDRPHREVHALADTVIPLVERGETGEALARIEEGRRGCLASISAVFSEAIRAVSTMNRELAIVVNHGGRLLAMTVDSADAVESLESTDFETLDNVVPAAADGVVAGVGRRRETGDTLLVLDVARIFSDFPAPAVAA